MGTRLRVLAGTAFFLTTLSACGGGGGGGGDGSDDTTVNIDQSQNSVAEFSRTKALTTIKSTVAYDNNITGSGVTVAVVDTGINSTLSEFAGRLHSASTSVVGNPNNVSDTDGHGTGVASVIGAAKDNQGTVGVAYDSSLMIVKADNGQGEFSNIGIVQALDHARTNGADIINLSLGGEGQTSSILKDALTRAVDAGALIVVAAGNSGGADPAQPANEAGLIDGNGEVIAVGALDLNNEIASFSNRAGVNKDFFITAPGVEVDIITNTGAVGSGTGTSYAAPLVSGAAALVKQNSPHLNGSQVAEILLNSATDLGAPGVDDVYGRGLLNVEAALQPLGTTRIASGQTVAETAATDPLLVTTQMRVNPVIAKTLKSASALQNVMILDAYDRSYSADVRSSISASNQTFDAQAWLSAPMVSTSQKLGATIAHGLSGFGAGNDTRLSFGQVQQGSLQHANSYLQLQQKLNERNTMGLAFGLQPSQSLGLSWQTTGSHPFLDGGQNESARNALSLNYAYDLNPNAQLNFVTSAKIDEDGDAFARVAAASVKVNVTPSFNLAFTGGVTKRPTFGTGSHLAQDAGGAFTFSDSVSTEFANVGASLQLAPKVSLTGSYALGSINDASQSFGLIREVTDVKADAFALTLTHTDTGLGHVFGKGTKDSLSFGISQPLRIKSGSLLLDVPVARDIAGNVERVSERLSLQPTALALKVSTQYRLSLPHNPSNGVFSGADLELQMGVTKNPGHDATAPSDRFAGIKFKKTF